MVTYSAGYQADHWCNKGHIVHCVQGSFISKLNTGQSVTLQEGQTYIVSDNTSYHLSFTEEGAKLFIIDGAFLANREV